MLIRTAGSQNALPAPMQPMLFPAVEPKRQVITVEPVVIPTTVVENKRLPFVEANTREVTLSHLRNECVVPVFSKDNEILSPILISSMLYMMQLVLYSLMRA